MTAAERLRALVKEATGGKPWAIYEEPHHGPDDDPKWTERYVTEGGVLLNYEPGHIPLRKAQLIALAPQLAKQLAAALDALEIIATKIYPATYVGFNEDGVAVYGNWDDAANFARERLASLDALFSEEDE